MRADKYFAEKFGSRTKAAEAIEKGFILLNGKPIKAKDEVKETDEITFVEAEESYVSNGGYKLSRALKTFPTDLCDKIAVDIGASTGGFTDCLLQNGAQKVYAVDVGESQLAASIATDSRVVVMDDTNARYLTKTDFSDPIDVAVTDVSFISLRLILPAISEILRADGVAFVLIKPQFECEKKNIGKSGIVHPSAHPNIVKKIIETCLELGLYPYGIVNAPVRKGKNIEYVLYLKKTSGGVSADYIVEKVKNLVKSNTLGELV